MLFISVIGGGSNNAIDNAINDAINDAIDDAINDAINDAIDDAINIRKRRWTRPQAAPDEHQRFNTELKSSGPSPTRWGGWEGPTRWGGWEGRSRREADDVAAAVDWVRREWTDLPVALYGTSLGAVAVLRAAARDVRVDALILESPFDRLLSTVRNRFDAMGLPGFPAAELLVFWGGVQLDFDGFEHNPVDDARRVRTPCSLLHGELDPRVTVAQSQALFAALAGPKERVDFVGAGHGGLAASGPGLWEERVTRFLRTHMPAVNAGADGD